MKNRLICLLIGITTITILLSCTTTSPAGTVEDYLEAVQTGGDTKPTMMYWCEIDLKGRQIVYWVILKTLENGGLSKAYEASYWVDVIVLFRDQSAEVHRFEVWLTDSGPSKEYRISSIQKTW